ncbi:MAG: TetR/AcrR family transcriptional regulator [Mycobacteriales bacterium]|nr:MAG: TetR family transcriptional regulator [Pseudonocardiales bacterium]
MSGIRRNENPTAQAIYRAAVDLFYKQGYAATTLRQVAERVGLQVGSLYNHITSKEEMLYRIMHGLMDDLIAETEAAMNAVDDPVEKIGAFMRAGIRFSGRNRRESLIGTTELRALTAGKRRSIIALRDRYQALLAGAIKEAAAAGRISVPDEQMSVFAGIAICAHVAGWYRDRQRLDLDDVADYLCKMYAPLASAKPGTSSARRPARSPAVAAERSSPAAGPLG